MVGSLAFRGIVGLLWALVVHDIVVCRGLFWDGAAFLANIVEYRAFHDFYAARAHIGWIGQAPILAALKAGVSQAQTLAMIQSAALFGLPAGLYTLALFRARRDPVLLAVVMAVVAIVYLPTSFFIIGEYNATYAAATATMVVVLTSDGRDWRDGAVVFALGWLCIASYEAMIYLGPLLAAVTVSRFCRRDNAGIVRLLGGLAALAFLGGCVVSGVTIIEYWNHPHFTRVRGAALDFWQNLQFVIPLVGLAIFGVVSLMRPAWLKGRKSVLVILGAAALLALTPWLRMIRPEAFLFPPAHYVARTAAGAVLLALLFSMWMYVAWQRLPHTWLVNLRDPAVGRRLVAATATLVLAAAVPDVSLTRLWSGHLDYVRESVVGRTGTVSPRDLSLQIWPHWLFGQEWSYPALSVLLRGAPGQAIVVPSREYSGDRPFDPRCGTVPRLDGMVWRR